MAGGTFGWGTAPSGLPKPMGMDALIKATEPSKKEQRELAQEQATTQARAIEQQVQTDFNANENFTQLAWSDQLKYIDAWDKEFGETWRKENFGDNWDSTDAKIAQQTALAPLRKTAKDGVTRTAQTWTNLGDDIKHGVQDLWALAPATTARVATGATREHTPEEDAEMIRLYIAQDDIQNSRELSEYRQQLRKRMDHLIRQGGDPDNPNWEFVTAALRDGDYGDILSLAASTAASSISTSIPILLGQLAGRGIGMLAGPAGAAVGEFLAEGFSAAAAAGTSGLDASEVFNTVRRMKPEVLRESQAYKDAKASGRFASEEDIINYVALKGADAAMPELMLANAAGSFISPAAMAGKTGAARLLPGGIVGRTLQGIGLGTAEEALQESWVTNASNRAMMRTVPESGITPYDGMKDSALLGALGGGPTIGGAAFGRAAVDMMRGSSTNVDPNLPTTTNPSDPNPNTAVVGGVNVYQQTQAPEAVQLNQTQIAERNAQIQAGRTAMNAATTKAQALIHDGVDNASVVMDDIINDLSTAQRSGVDSNTIESIVASVDNSSNGKGFAARWATELSNIQQAAQTAPATSVEQATATLNSMTADTTGVDIDFTNVQAAIDILQEDGQLTPEQVDQWRGYAQQRQAGSTLYNIQTNGDFTDSAQRTAFYDALKVLAEGTTARNVGGFLQSQLDTVSQASGVDAVAEYQARRRQTPQPIQVASQAAPPSIVPRHNDVPVRGSQAAPAASEAAPAPSGQTAPQTAAVPPRTVEAPTRGLPRERGHLASERGRDATVARLRQELTQRNGPINPATEAITEATTDAAVQQFLHQQLLANGRTVESAEIESTILTRMMNTLRSISGLTHAQQLRRLTFGVGKNPVEIMNSLFQLVFHGSSNPQAFTEIDMDRMSMMNDRWGLYVTFSRYLADSYAGVNGHLYGIEVSDTGYADWGLRLDRQPPDVQEKLRTVGMNNTQTFLQFYIQLRKQLGTARAASEHLAQAGLNGIRYYSGLHTDSAGKFVQDLIIFNKDAILSLDVLRQDSRGQIDFLSDGTARIIFSENADASTAIHEFQHFYMQEAFNILSDESIPDSAYKRRLAEDMRVLGKFAGVEGDATLRDAWSTEQHETIAKAFEKYIRTGKAPNNSLKYVFDKLKKLLTDVYAKAKYIMKGDIPADVRKVFDNQLTGYTNEQVRQIEQGRTDSVGEAGNPTDSQSEADTGPVGDTVLAPDNAPTTGTGGTATRTGTGGAAYAGTGTPQANIQPSQPIRTTGQRADSGRSGEVINAAGPESDTQQRSSTGSTEQRTGDDGRISDTGVPEVDWNPEQIAAERETQLEIIRDNLRADNPDLTPAQIENMAQAQLFMEQQADIISPEEAVEVVEEARTARELSEEDRMQREVDNRSLARMLAEPGAILHPINQMQVTEQELDILMRGTLTPDAEVAGKANNMNRDQPESTSAPQRTAAEPEIELTDEENEVESLSVADTVRNIISSIATPDPIVITQRDGTHTLDANPPVDSQTNTAVSDIIMTQDREITESQETGRLRNRALRALWNSGLLGSPQAASRTRNIMATLDTWLADADGKLRMMLHEMAPANKGGTDTNPAVQALITHKPKVGAILQLLMDQFITPVSVELKRVSQSTGVSIIEVMRDLGEATRDYAIIEREPQFRARLSAELDAAQAELLRNPTPANQARAQELQIQFDHYVSWQENPDMATRIPGQPEPDQFHVKVGNKTLDVRYAGGMTRWQAENHYISMVEKYGLETVERITDMQRTSIRGIARTLQQNGCIDDATAESWRNQFFYAPLMVENPSGDGAVNDISMFSPKMNYRLRGSQTPAMDSWSAMNMFAQRAAKSIAMQELGVHLNEVYKRVGENNRWGFIREDADQIYAQKEAAQGSDVDALNAQLERMDAIIRVMEDQTAEDGTVTQVMKTYGLRFDQEKNPGMHVSFRRALETDPTIVSKAARAMETATKGYGMMMTFFRPFFTATNAYIDANERLLNMQARTWVSADGQSVSGTEVSATYSMMIMNSDFISAHLRDELGKGPAIGHETTWMEQIRNEFKYSGVMNSTFRTMLEFPANKSVAEVNDLLKQLDPSMPKKIGRTAYKALMAYSDLMYNAPIFAQYAALRKHGLSSQAAAAATLDMMDMRRVGTATQHLKKFFPFVPSVTQGAKQLFRTAGIHGAMVNGNADMKRAALRGWVTMSAVSMSLYGLSSMLSASAGEDDAGYNYFDMIPIGKLMQGIPIFTDDKGSYYMINGGFGPFQIASAIGYGMYRYEKGLMDEYEFGSTIINAFTKNIVPGSQPEFAMKEAPLAYMVQTLSPALLKPTLEVITGRNYLGANITQEQYLNPTQRSSDVNQLGTADFWKDLTKFMYDTTGWDTAPENVRHWVNGMSAGVLQIIPYFAEKATGHRPIPGYETVRDQLGIWGILGLSKVYTPGTDKTSQAYYSMKEQMEAQVKDAGIDAVLKAHGSNNREYVRAYKTRIFEQAGFSPEWIHDWWLKEEADKDLTGAATPYKDKLEAMRKAGIEDPTLFDDQLLQWRQATDATRTNAVRRSFYWTNPRSRQYGVPNRDTANMLRNR